MSKQKSIGTVKRYDFLFKVLLVGPRDGGKLEILRRIPFPDDADEMPTATIGNRNFFSLDLLFALEYK